MTSHISDVSLFEPSFHSDSPLNSISTQCIQDCNEEKISDSQQKETVKIKLPFDDDDSYSEHKGHMSDEADEQDNHLHSKQLAVKYKKHSTNKNEISDKLEIHTKSSNGCSDFSDSSDDPEVAAKKRKKQKSKDNLYLKQTVVKYKKDSATKNKSSAKYQVPSSDSSEESEVASPDSSVEWTPSSQSSGSDDSYDPDYHKKAKNVKKEISKVSTKKKKNEKSKKASVENSKPKVELSEYEKMIQKNRDERLAFLQSLRMDEAKGDLKESITAIRGKKKRIMSSKKSSKGAQDPPRQSLRLAEMATYHRTRAQTDVEEEVWEKSPSTLTFEEVFSESNTYANFVQDFENLDFKKVEPITDYVPCFKNMKIEKSKIFRAAPGKITAMAFHPMKEKVFISVGTQDGNICFRHMNSDSVPYILAPHFADVSCMKFNADFPNQIISCSFDGSVKCGDMEKRIFSEVLDVWGETFCNCFDFISPTSAIVCHRNGNVSVVDIRSDSKSAETTHRCHRSSVRTVSVHPVNKNYFVTADMKGFLSLWDLRKLEEKPSIEVKNQMWFATAMFSPVAGNSILAYSPKKDTLCLFDCSKLGSAISLYRNFSRNIAHTRYFKPTWLPNTDDAFVVGSDAFPRKIEVYNNQLENIYNFQDNCLSLTAYNEFHPSLPVLAGACASGLLYTFS